MEAVALRGLAGKKVLITGAAKGQGFSHAKAFAEAGCDIAALDTTQPVDADVYDVATSAMLEQTVAAVEDRGQHGVALPCDIRDEVQVQRAIERALDTFEGVIDVLVNNAGIAALDSIQGMRSNVLHAIIDTNLKGAMFVTKHASDNMIGRRSGNIINISSAVAGSAPAMLSHYAATKHGINGLTASWAMELAEFNINVNAICPATVRPGQGQGSGMVLGLATQMGMDPEDAFEHFSAKNNMAGQKWRVESRHITDAVLFLASDNAAMITGAVIPVDGGHMSR